MKNYKFFIDGMHCQSCVAKINANLTNLQGVKSFQVDLDNHSLTSEFSSDLSPMGIKKSVEELGFKVIKMEKIDGKN